jgi:asparagine synthase (glutamine-hydrolysing)
MCGIAGIVTQNKAYLNEPNLLKMATALSHRGPDGNGTFINTQIGLAHTRLSIIDLSQNAAQPMHYLDKYTIVFNGEIYNYKELKHSLQLKGYQFYNESDTEVILAAYDFYKDDCVNYFDGMFAFAIYNNVTNTVFCARDIFGEKPFYYFLNKELFAFASEMKALWAIGIDKHTNETMMAQYLCKGSVQLANNKSSTFYDNILSLPPAHAAVYDITTQTLTIKRYYDIDKETTSNISENEATDKINYLLTNSVSKRLRSDVPVGCSLSGGIDSSTIAYLINNQNNHQGFKTFSAVFPGFEKDESELIKTLSKQLNFETNFTTPTANDLISDFEKISYHQEEPVASASVLAQYKVYELAATNNTKVLLDGQGADEAFAGYTKYIHWYLQELLYKNKFSECETQKKLLQQNNIDFNWNFKNYFAAYMPSYAAYALEKKASNKIMHNTIITKDVMNIVTENKAFSIYKPTVTKLNDILYHNCMEQGLEELLRYADRNSMAHGVEVRLPFLNKELVQFVFSLPSHFKINNGFTKSILRKTMQHKIPDAILWNPIKTGFEPPQKTWMVDKTVQDLIHESKKKLVQQKILKPVMLTKKIIATGAHEENNFDWRVLSLGSVIKT